MADGTFDQKSVIGLTFPVLLAASLCHLLNDLMQSVFTATYPLIKSEFGLTFAQIGLLTLTYQMSASILQPLIGLATDRRPLPYSLPFASVFSMSGIFILDGRWDNAAVEVWRVNWSAPAQRVLLRRGAIGQIRRGRLAFVAEVRSLAHVLGQTVGRTFQASCEAALGDTRCGVNLETPAFKGTGSVIDVLRDRAFTASGLGSFAAGWFAFGLVEWSTGANAGRLVEVLSHDLVDGVAILTLLEAPVRPIMPTDAFIIRAGCDKRIATCSTKFANVANFRGFPHIPGQDAVLRYATKDGGHEGAVL